MASPDLKLLVRERGAIKTKLTNVFKFVTDCQNDTAHPTVLELELRIANSIDLLKDYNNIQQKIESKCDEQDLDAHYKERQPFEEKYYFVQGYLSNLVNNLKNANQIAPQTQASVSLIASAPCQTTGIDSLENILLPKIKLTNFDGNLEDWLKFKSDFNSTIIDNKSLSDRQKFKFLKASLVGYAATFIEGLENEVNPFDSAWNILSSKFDKKRLLLDVHFQQLINVQSLNKENFSQTNQFLDQITKHLTAIKGIQLKPEELYDSFLIFLLSGKLDKGCFREWKEMKHAAELPTIEEFVSFVKNKVDVLQSIDQTYYKSNEIGQNKLKNSKYHNTHVGLNETNSFNQTTISCNFCKQNHRIYKCPEFLALTVSNRINNAKRLKLCLNCLRFGHNSDKCNSDSCRTCKSSGKTLKHNSLLHLEINNKTTEAPASTEVNICTQVQPLNEINEQSHKVLLSTISCKIKGNDGQFKKCRALLDCGSQSNLITAEFCKKLQLKCSSTNVIMTGINQIRTTISAQCVVTLNSVYTDFSVTLPCLVVPIISSHSPEFKFNVQQFKIPNHVQLADPDFCVGSKVDLLLGAGVFWNLLQDGKIELCGKKIILHNTHFGYVVSGFLPKIPAKSIICNFSNFEHCAEDKQLKKFWELEEVAHPVKRLEDDQECEKLFDESTFVNDKNQFVVKFPFKYSPNLLGSSKEIASKRFMQLEKRFSNFKFKNLYFEFINEYIELGHASKVTPNLIENHEKCYFLPHHGVLKEQSITTKLRTVFDGSCSTTTGWSLNDLQFIGPKLQVDIFDILLRFRIHDYVVLADISKMYRCILMHPDHRKYQQILWRNSPNEELCTYQLNTVSYGTSSAPYLAIKCLQSIAIKNSSNYPDSASTILNDFYVDDLITGSDNIEQLNKKCHEIYSLLSSFHFVLRKWISNNSLVISGFEEIETSNAVLKLGKNESCKTLGIQWFHNSDELSYNVKNSGLDSTNKFTKRQILSIISQIYDPLGLISPIILISKLMIQELWSLKMSWDEIVPNKINDAFNQFTSDLGKLNQLTIPRSCKFKNYKLLDLHCFCDASQSAYAAAIYLRSCNENGDINVQLMCAKTKISPLKMLTIPKLELCAALLGAKLINSVKTALQTVIPLFMWSDSQITLSWIASDPKKLQVFVANRVSQVQAISKKESWYYVPSKENPADIASRGETVEKLINSKLWWFGPKFLKEPENLWPVSCKYLPIHQLPEIKKKCLVFTAKIAEPFYLFLKFSELPKLIKVTAIIIRFIQNLRAKVAKLPLSVEKINVQDLEHAKLSLVKIVQTECFQNEISTLNKNKSLDKKHKFSSLAPFIDSEGILRVGGRLRCTNLPYSKKHPVLLPHNHVFTKLLFDYKHKVLLHPGPQLLLSSIRQFYWPIKGKIIAKKTTKNCITCFKFNPTPFQAPMSDIPNNRIESLFPFQTCGIDYAGPFSILNKSGRGSKIIKCYLAVFVCFCSKAVHLEIVENLTTEHFLACLKRFIARRGVPHDIYSDNGTTFHGASNELRELGNFIYKNQNVIENYANEYCISWHFIPPYSPNFGGLWEAAVKSAKHHLKRVLVNINVTYVELLTLTVQIEGILNSRPLFSMSEDPNDLNPITPSHFLIGRSISFIPEPDYANIKSCKLSRLQHIQQLLQQFWLQFQKHYISNFHQQYKWKNSPSIVQSGVLVLVQNDNQPTCNWALGRILNVLPSRDGKPRVCEVLTKSGITKRSIRHLYPLPNQNETDN